MFRRDKGLIRLRSSVVAITDRSFGHADLEIRLGIDDTLMMMFSLILVFVTESIDMPRSSVKNATVSNESSSEAHAKEYRKIYPSVVVNALSPHSAEPYTLNSENRHLGTSTTTMALLALIVSLSLLKPVRRSINTVLHRGTLPAPSKMEAHRG